MRNREQRPKLLIQNYRATFDRSEAGKATLAHLLSTYGLLSRVENDAQRERHNMGIELLEHLGVVQGPNWEALVGAILRLTIPEEALEKDEVDGRR